MPKLYELVAVQNDAATKANTIVAETTKVLIHNTNLFTGHVKTTVAFDQARTQELDSIEHKERATTVPDRLAYTFKELIDEVNRGATIDQTNSQAKSDIIVDDVVIAEKVPSVTLLALERKIKSWKAMFDAMPTLQAGTSWIKAPEEGPNVYKTEHPNIKKRTEKKSVVVVLAPATDKHPAQVKENITDVPVADITQIDYSGMITSEQKAGMLDRADRLLRAVVAARTRANDLEVVNLKPGKAIAEYLLGFKL
jgi:hypothetical protein